MLQLPKPVPSHPGIGSESGTKPNSKSRILPISQSTEQEARLKLDLVLAGTRYRIWSFAPKPVFCNAARRAHEWFCILQYYHTVPLSAIGGCISLLYCLNCKIDRTHRVLRSLSAIGGCTGLLQHLNCGPTGAIECYGGL